MFFVSQLQGEMRVDIKQISIYFHVLLLYTIHFCFNKSHSNCDIWKNILK